MAKFLFIYREAGLERLAAVLPGSIRARYPGWHVVIGELHFRLGRHSAARRACVLAVHEALQELEAHDPLEARIVLLRYFTGLTMDETAAVLGVPERSLDRHWRYIRAWLMKRLR
jgi:DNA-directed RNA polymerase specialized sigma24 family protein